MTRLIQNNYISHTPNQKWKEIFEMNTIVKYAISEQHILNVRKKRYIDTREKLFFIFHISKKISPWNTKWNRVEFYQTLNKRRFKKFGTR